MDSLLSFLTKLKCALQTDSNLLLAYSGGVDSHVLLDAVCQLQRTGYPIRCRALYVNHHLHPDSNAWQQHCARVCELLQVPFQAVDIDVWKTVGESVEALARAARYATIASMMQPGETVLTAHHEDDQAETVLLQLLRGAGLKGLSGIAAKKPFGVGQLQRPLLSFSKESIMHYAQARELQWIEDSSNLETAFRRNYLRHEIIPLLKTRWPKASTTLSRSAAHCAQAEALLAESVMQEMHALFDEASRSLDITRLQAFSPERQKMILRAFIARLNLPLPSSDKVEHLISNVLEAKKDAMPELRWPGVEIRRYQGKLFAFAPLAAHDVTQVVDWDIAEALTFSSGVLMARPTPHGLDISKRCRVSVRFRQGGEVLQIQGRGSRPLKKLFQEWGVYPWWRERVPLIYIDDHLAAVVGFATDPRFRWMGSSIHFTMTT